jgi:transposase-like protein
MGGRSGAKPRSLFCFFNSSPEVIRPGGMTYVRVPLSLRKVEGLLFQPLIDISHNILRFWRNRFGPMFERDICRQLVLRT